MKCITYRPYWVRATARLKKFSAIPDAWREQFHRALPVHQKLFESISPGPSAIIDRTGAIEPIFPTTILQPLPDNLESFSKSFETCCLQQATELIGTGRPLIVYWSGGIDSTVIVTALIAVGVHRDQLQIRLTWNSVMENPVFYRDVVTRYHHDLKSDHNAQLPRDSVDLIITGEPGDMLFGSSFLTSYASEQLWKPYKDVFDKTVTEIVEPMYWHSPRPVVMVLDAMCYMAVNMKWQALNTKWQCIAGISGQEFSAGIVNFFDTPDFQRWGIMTDEPRILYGDPRSHKWPAKQFIHKYAPDETYLNTKNKVDSYQAMGVQSRSWNYLTSDWTLVQSGSTNFGRQSVDKIK